MAPNIHACEDVTRGSEPLITSQTSVEEKRANKIDTNNNGKIINGDVQPEQKRWVWRNIIFIGYVHLMLPYGIWCCYQHTSFPGKLFSK